MEVGIGGQARRGHGNRGLVSSPFLYPHHRGTQPVRQQVSRGLTVVCTHTHTPPKKMVSAPPFARVPPARPSPGPDEDAQCKSFSIRSTWVKTIRRQQYRLRPSPSSASLRFPVSARREVCKGHGGGNGPFGVARFEKLQVLRPAVADDLAATEAAHGDDPARARARVSESDPGGGGAQFGTYIVLLWPVLGGEQATRGRREWRKTRGLDCAKLPVVSHNPRPRARPMSLYRRFARSLRLGKEKFYVGADLEGLPSLPSRRSRTRELTIGWQGTRSTRGRARNMVRPLLATEGGQARADARAGCGREQRTSGARRSARSSTRSRGR